MAGAGAKSLSPRDASPEWTVLTEAVIDVMVERGYEATTVEEVVKRADLTVTEFERNFVDLQDCVLQAYWRYTDDFTDLLVSTYERGPSWRDGLRTAAYEAARYIRDNPRIVKFGTVRMFQAGLMAQAQRETHLHRMVDLIDAGRGELEDPDSMSRSVAEAAFGSIYEAIVKDLQAGKGTKRAEDFVPELMYIAVRPYLGHEVAREELSIPPPGEVPESG